jgi:hypothetical protein
VCLTCVLLHLLRCPAQPIARATLADLLTEDVRTYTRQVYDLAFEEDQ